LLAQSHLGEEHNILGYEPIQNYGIIGDLHTAALVSVKGSIDWLCLPNFDSPSVFASILDEKKGGQFRIACATDGVTYKQFYWPQTNILVTRHLSQDGVGEITDFMPITEPPGSREKHRLIRRVGVVRGTMRFRLECRPAFNYARDPHKTELTPNGARFHSSGISLELLTNAALKDDGRNGITAEFVLREGECCTFLLQQITPEEERCQALSTAEAHAQFEETVEYWRRWVSGCSYKGRWREIVQRSALILKLLTYEPTGAIVAAPTCSLPELIGGERNWDYRYTWIRDAAFTLYALMRIGFTDEAAKFMSWIEARCHETEPDGSLQILYRVDGGHECAEETLDHLEGHRQSRPVRIGNGAYRQHQLDIYGELMDSVYLYNKYGSPISHELWNDLRKPLDWVCKHWREKDFGIWEVRGEPRNFVYSKVMSWVALDRGLRLAAKRSFPADRDLWLRNRDAIYDEVHREGWNPKRRAFVQYYGSDSLDAANLIMPLVFFLSPTDPRMLSTLAAINKPPAKGGLASDSLVYRYDVNQRVDGLGGDEGSFNMCTFWLVEAMTRAGRKDRSLLDRARLLFEKMLGYANHLGLFSEQTGPCGEALGNFPQALTHLALISAAYNLDRALSSRKST
jgi:GH15 family glucan-1,4-alpha-glucosidase